jgi:hypothetical protein
MKDRRPFERPVASRTFVLAFVCLEVAYQILSLYTVSGLGIVKVPCLGIHSTDAGEGEDASLDESAPTFLPVFLDLLLASPPTGADPDLLEDDADCVLLSSEGLTGQVKAWLPPVLARTAVERPVKPEAARRNVLHPVAALTVGLPTRLCRLTC